MLSKTFSCVILSMILFFGLTMDGVSGQPKQAGENKDVKSDKAIIKAYYFHTAYRCPSCIRIEKWSHEAIQFYFSEKIKAGKIVWETVAVDKPENKHFVKDYQLYTKSLILVEMNNNQTQKWKNLPKVWQLLGDQQAFFKYVKQEVNQFMGQK